jgi:alpha-ketoglutarate-dependent taurine dioxygenase
MEIGQIPRARARRAVKLADVELVKVGRVPEVERSPVVIEPASPDVDLAEWGAAHRDEIESHLLDAGAVLFRGFGLRTAADFERATGAIDSRLYGGYGDLPRAEGSTSNNIYKSTPYPADQPILFHNESSHLPSWPMRISFFCVIPSEKGGETPLADCREICRRLDPEVLDEFRTKGLSYVRNFAPGLDVSWQQFFQTEDRAAVEEACREGGMGFEWKGEDGLRVMQPAAAVRNHPVSGEELFFNQIQLHHIYCLQPEVRESLLSIYGPDDLPRNVHFGDGSPIPDETVQHVLDVYWDTCVMFPWQQGDIIMLDNMLVAHARMPFEGERSIAVAMAGMTDGSGAS